MPMFGLLPLKCVFSFCYAYYMLPVHILTMFTCRGGGRGLGARSQALFTHYPQLGRCSLPRGSLCVPGEYHRLIGLDNVFT